MSSATHFCLLVEYRRILVALKFGHHRYPIHCQTPLASLQLSIRIMLLFHYLLKKKTSLHLRSRWADPIFSDIAIHHFERMHFVDIIPLLTSTKHHFQWCCSEISLQLNDISRIMSPIFPLCFVVETILLVLEKSTFWIPFGDETWHLRTWYIYIYMYIYIYI